MSSHKRLIVIDSLAVIRLLYNTLQNYHIAGENRSAYIQGSLEWIHQGAWVPLFMEAPEDNITLWVMDSPPYWRKEIYPAYKGNRPPKPPELIELIEQFKNSNIPKILSPGQEADDLAASILRQWKNRRPESPFHQIFFGTVDSDWLGLVEDEGAFWLGLNAKSTPRIRQKREAYDLFVKLWSKAPKKRVKAVWPLMPFEDFQATDIFRLKALLGDSSDNIKTPRNMPDNVDSIDLIDLHNPPSQYRLEREDWLQSAILASAAWKPSMDSREFEKWAIGELSLLPPVLQLPMSPRAASVGLPSPLMAA